MKSFRKFCLKELNDRRVVNRIVCIGNMYLIMLDKYVWDKSTAHVPMGRICCCDKACVKCYTVYDSALWYAEQFLRDQSACSWRRNFSSRYVWNRIEILSYECYLWQVVCFIQVVGISARTREIMRVINCNASFELSVLLHSVIWELLETLNTNTTISDFIFRQSFLYVCREVYIDQILIFCHHFSNCLILSKPLLQLLLEIMWFLSIGFLPFFFIYFRVRFLPSSCVK